MRGSPAPTVADGSRVAGGGARHLVALEAHTRLVLNFGVVCHNLSQKLSAITSSLDPVAIERRVTLKHRLVFAGTLILCLAFYGACSSEEPGSSSSSPTITAPTPQSPAVGATVSSTSPTLTVTNASGASGLRYRFEVASDASFGNIIASGDDLPEGGTGSTSWQVSPNLGIGQTYYWRARASVGGTQGPFSPAANFEVQGGFASSTPVGSVFVSDPLTNGVSVGEVGGGEFQTEGWMATDALSYIRYDIPTTPNGFVEFQVSNLMDLNPHSAKRNLLIMWDPTRGDYTENPFRVHIAKYDTRLVNRWHMRLRFISNGQETNTGINLFDWDPSRTYTFRLEWGAFPEIVSSQRARVLLDGAVIMTRNYDPLYRPAQHVVELGMAPRAESLEQAIYSNVTIGVRRP